MNKAKIKGLLVDKGERYGLIAAGGAMLLFLILGVMAFSDSPNPESYVTTVEQNTNTVNTKINGAVASGTVKELPDHIKNPKPDVEKWKSTWANNLFFDPFAPPDNRRVNPIALALTDTQADFMWAKIVAYDIKDDLIGVLVKSKSKKDTADNETNPKFLEELKKRFKLPGIRLNPNPAPPADGGIGQGGQQPGFGGAPMQPGIGAAPGMPGQPGRGRGPQRGAGALVEDGPRNGIQYLPLDPEKLQGHRFALTIYPRHLVVIQAALPYKAQIEEIQKALRLQDQNDVFNVYPGETVPQYRGFVVQRQTLAPDGKEIDTWADLDVQQSYREIFRRRYQFDEDPRNNYVLLHSGHRLTMPLPVLLGEKYADLRIPALKEAIQKQEALRLPPEPPKAPSQFDDNANIFDTGAANSAATSGQPNIGREGINIQRAPQPQGDPAKAGTLQASFKDLPEFMLVRAVDCDIVPGYIYKYRIKVLLQNPNWVGAAKDKKDEVPHKEKYNLVSRPADADVEIIESPWTDVKETVSVPQEKFLFAVDPLPDPKDPKGRWLNNPLKEGQGLLQIQRWMSNITAFGNNKEPVGDWVVADVVATRGTYLGGKQFVNLPLWSSEENKYLLREVPPERGRKESRRGVVFDPTRPGSRFAVVEVEGGMSEFRHPIKSINMREETATEVMLMDDDGNLQVRSSYSDRFDDSRAKREESWKAWIERTQPEVGAAPPEKDFK
jgi:hypothetical protein